MQRRAEIGIIGAGPAGARAAELFAALGARVVLLDPKVPWEKPCGGGLTPPAFDAMPELNALRPLARAVQGVRVETGPHDGFTVSLERPVSIVSREVLGRWQLARATAAGARHLRWRVRGIHRAFGAWILETANGDLAIELLVGADGAASLVRRTTAPKFEVELAPTRVAYPAGAGPTPEQATVRLYEGFAGYLWDFPRPGHRSVGIGVPNGTWRRGRLDGEIDLHRLSSEGCACDDVGRAGAVIGTAQLGHGDYSRIAGRDFALLGDAAGFADPLTGEGIWNAMRSADLLVQAWAGGGVEGYPALARAAFEREFQLARILRRSVFESELGTRLVAKAARSRSWHALLTALVNGINEHDPHPARLLVRWIRTARRQTVLQAGVRPSAVPRCACGCGPGRAERACSLEGAAVA